MTTLADDADVRCRAGLGRALRALVGGATEETAAALARLDRDTPALPWLPGLVYRALTPLGVAFDEHDPLAVAAGAALIGRPVPAARLRVALGQLPAAPPASRAPDPELAAAIEAFWDRLAEVAEEIGRAWRAGDPASARQAASAAVPDLRARAAAVVEARGDVLVDERPAGDADPAPAPDEAAADGASPEELPAAPVLELDDAPVPPDRPRSALAFALLALTIALLVLLAVLGGFPAG